ncbi:MAG: hypothetical protein IIC55_07945 [Proteobacteria bacterium]|nr:hypothetical protein [Pseudomonadota bacterium]
MIEPDEITLAEAIEVLGERLEPSPDEARNGWNAETLTIYHAQMKLAEGGKMPAAFCPLPTGADDEV